MRAFLADVGAAGYASKLNDRGEAPGQIMPDDASDERLVGAKDGDYIYECTVSHAPSTHPHAHPHPHPHPHPHIRTPIADPAQRYVWRNHRQSSDLEEDRKFATRRMALLYVAKMNSDSFCSHLQVAGSDWEQLSPGEGQHALHPNRPFDRGFLDLSDAVLEAYGRGIALLFAVHKTQCGTVYECAPRKIATTSVRELDLLLCAPTAVPSAGNGTSQAGCATAPHVGRPALAQAVRGGPPR